MTTQAITKPVYKNDNTMIGFTESMYSPQIISTTNKEIAAMPVVKNIDLIHDYLRMVGTLTVLFNASIKCEAVIERIHNDFYHIGLYSIKMTVGGELSSTISQVELRDKLVLGEYRLSIDSEYNLAIFAAHKTIEPAHIAVIKATATAESKGDMEYRAVLIKKYTELYDQFKDLKLHLRPMTIKDIQVGDILGCSNGGEVVKVNRVNLVVKCGNDKTRNVKWDSTEMHVRRGNDVFIQSDSSYKRAAEMMEKVGLSPAPLSQAFVQSPTTPAPDSEPVPVVDDNGRWGGKDDQKIMYARHGEQVVLINLSESERFTYNCLEVGGLYTIDHCYSPDNSDLYLSDYRGVLGRVSAGNVVSHDKARSSLTRGVLKSVWQLKKATIYNAINDNCIDVVRTEYSYIVSDLVERIVESLSPLEFIGRLEAGVYKFIGRLEAGVYKFIGRLEAGVYKQQERIHRLAICEGINRRINHENKAQYLFDKWGNKYKFTRSNDINHTYMLDGAEIGQRDILDKVIDGSLVTVNELTLIYAPNFTRADLKVGDDIHLTLNYSGVIVKINPKTIVIKSNHHDGKEVAIEWIECDGGYIRRGLDVFFRNEREYECSLAYSVD